MRITKQDMKIWDEEAEFNSIDWFRNDRFHREDGPAEVWSDGEVFFYLNDIEYLKNDYWKEIHENY